MRWLVLGLLFAAGCATETVKDKDGDGYFLPEDCNDTDANIRPNVGESCDSIDNNCDGQVDEDGAFYAPYFYADADGDGFGTPDLSVQTCLQPTGYVERQGDCADDDSRISPDAEEKCNTKDDDCNGIVDDSPSDINTWFADQDEDGFGDPDTSKDACDQPTGYVSNDNDCDDDDAQVTESSDWFDDNDNDGFGDPTRRSTSCTAPNGYVADDTDCNDDDDTINPAAAEICDGDDDNCDGTTDEGVISTFYADADNDGFGDANTTMAACTISTGFVDNSSDCNDADLSVNPGAAEICDNQDNNCDGLVDDNDPTIDPNSQSPFYADQDGDTWGAGSAILACLATPGFSSTAGDCDDTDATAFPGGTDLPGDGVDQDCDGTGLCDLLSSSSGDFSLVDDVDGQNFCADYNYIDGNLDILATALTDLSSLSCLCGISGSLTISSNADLLSLSGLDYLRAIPGDLTITDNVQLPTADVNTFAAQLTVTGSTTVSGNGP